VQIDVGPRADDVDATSQVPLRVVRWTGSSVGADGHDARARYVEQFWLPVLGPTAIWMIRRLADRFDDEPDGFDLDLDELALCLGLGPTASRYSPVRRAVARCVRFGIARSDGQTLAVLERLPTVSSRHLIRLPIPLQERHRAWMEEHVDADEAVRLRRRARLVALDLRELGVDDASIERHLLRRGVHPATAFEAARWAWSPESEADRPLVVLG
jgi:hypothetical protein